jgi:hypothetical protein
MEAAMKEITEFHCEGGLRVVVAGSDLRVEKETGMEDIQSVYFQLTRSQARDLSKALSHAADIVRTKRNRSKPNV